MRTSFFYILLISINFLIAQEWSVSNIPIAISQGAKAVIQEKQTLIKLHKIDEMTVERSVVLTIFKEEGNQYTSFPVYYNDNTEILNYRVEVLDTNGKRLKKLKEKDFRDISAVDNGTLYAADRIKFFTYTPTEYPYTIKLSYKIKTSNTAFIPNWSPIPHYNIGLIKDEFTFINDSNIEVKKKEVNFDSFNIQKYKLADELKYTLQNQPPINQEYLAPDLTELTPKTYFSPKTFSLAGYHGNADSWQSFGQWMYDDLLIGSQNLPSAERDKVKELVTGIDSDKEKVRILYQYMQDKTRYINVAIGIGGWRPFPAENVSNKGYGDCKALSNYMMSLLAEVGIDSNYIIVYGGRSNKRDIQEDFPSMQGNHVILNVPLKQDTIWLECTSQQIAFNHLGAFTNDRNALAVNNEGGSIVRTQRYPYSINKENISAEGQIKSDGTLLLNFTNVTSGIQYDWNYQVGYEDKNRQINWLQNKYQDLKQKKLLNFSFNNKKNIGEFVQEVSLVANAFGQLTGNNIIIPSVPLGKTTTSLKKMNNRHYPFKISVGYTDEAIFNLLLPNNYTINYDLQPIEKETKFGSYHLSYKFIDQNLQITRKLIIKEGLFPKEKFNEYVEFRREIEKADKSKILLEKI